MGDVKENVIEAIRQEVEEEIGLTVGRVLRDRQQLGHVDLEASENALRASMHRAGGRVLEKLLNADRGGYRGSRIDCPKGHHAKFVENRSKQVVTVLAPVEVDRAYYYCAPCGQGVIPKDQDLDSDCRS